MDKTDFYDIYDYEYTPFLQTMTAKMIILTICLLIIGLMAYVIYQVVKKRRQAKSIVMVWDWALGELEKHVSHLPQSKQEVKIFYFSLTGIIKKYLAKRYGWAVEDKTDEELISFLRKVKFDPSLCENLESLLSSVVEIKFADAQTVKEYIDRDLAIAKNIVIQTIPKEPQ